MERLRRLSVLLSAVVLRSAWRLYDHWAGSYRLPMRPPIVVGHELQRCACQRSALACDALRWGALLAEQLPPRRLSGLASQEFDGGLALACTARVAPLVMGKPAQIYGLLGDLSFATMQRGSNERIDHLDERGGPDNRVERVEHQGFESVKLVANEPFGS